MIKVRLQGAFSNAILYCYNSWFYFLWDAQVLLDFKKYATSVGACETDLQT